MSLQAPCELMTKSNDRRGWMSDDGSWKEEEGRGKDGPQECLLSDSLGPVPALLVERQVHHP